MKLECLPPSVQRIRPVLMFLRRAQVDGDRFVALFEQCVREPHTVIAQDCPFARLCIDQRHDVLPNLLVRVGLNSDSAIRIQAERLVDLDVDRLAAPLKLLAATAGTGRVSVESHAPFLPLGTRMRKSIH